MVTCKEKCHNYSSINIYELSPFALQDLIYIFYFELYILLLRSKFNKLIKKTQNNRPDAVIGGLQSKMA